MTDLEQTLKTLRAAAKRKRERAFDFFVPYPKQKQFMELGATKRERLFMAGNQVGKSHCGAFEAACHATGEYPSWWTGKKFDHPTRGWVAGVTSLDVRNVQQKKLCGTPGVTADFGTGMIPKESFRDKPSLSHGVTDAFDTVQVQHKTNGSDDGISTIHFKSYEQGRTKFQGDTIDWGWGDEEAEKQEVYEEFKARLTGKGIIFTTFTPLFGRTKLVQSFLDEKHPDRAYVVMELKDAEHFTEEEKRARREGYDSHEREAREKGVPLLGSGAIFLTPEINVIEPPITHIPEYWVKLWGIDEGIDHPFGAVLILWDRENDVVHIHHTIKLVGALSIVQAAAMKRIGAAVPVAWPQTALAREKGSGEQLKDTYKKHGLLMLDEHATWPDGGVSTEAGVKEWDEREKTGRLKIAAQLSEILEERRFYHRKDGQIVKIRDDLLSAGRTALMMKRRAKMVPLGNKTVQRIVPGTIADGTDFDVFAIGD